MGELLEKWMDGCTVYSTMQLKPISIYDLNFLKISLTFRYMSIMFFTVYYS